MDTDCEPEGKFNANAQRHSATEPGVEHEDRRGDRLRDGEISKALIERATERTDP